MSSFSWKCAVSCQSIPAGCVEPTDVTLFLPDGTTRRGVYDGYGRLEAGDNQVDIIQTVREALRGQGRSGVEVAATGMATAQERVRAVLEAVMAHVKLVKTKYVTPSMTYDELPVSGKCEYQGVFYDRPGQWNEPVYEESTVNESQEQQKAVTRPVCRG